MVTFGWRQMVREDGLKNKSDLSHEPQRKFALIRFQRQGMTCINEMHTTGINIKETNRVNLYVVA